ncbi:hypothetical protein BSZ39_10310 [Bowdeniella nasicola]|uniref:PKD domain-containing protein n=2 Tax=Bowdeniella nasicola TaxID=208480 RepID=A0A1Q5Q0Y2_9ACTO|nr:hypothetical protein BSZ39_10310 [Bowdeniella nasicola]
MPAPGLEFIALCPHPDDPKREIECRSFGDGEGPDPVKVVVQPVDPGPPRPVTIEEFKNFPVAKGEILLQPDQGHHTVNMPVVAATTARQHIVSGEILGYPFHVRFTPISYTFDYGDATDPITTSDPNSPYPNNRFWHEWPRTGTFTISVTTTWSGAYQVAGSPWVDVEGTLTTTVSSEPQQVSEYHILLKHPDTPDDPGYGGYPGTPGNPLPPDELPGRPDHTITPPDPVREDSPT